MRRGEFVITAGGIEGGLVYALSAGLRDTIERNGSATLEIDLLPDRDTAQVATEVTRPARLALARQPPAEPARAQGRQGGLLREVLGADDFADTKNWRRQSNACR